MVKMGEGYHGWFVMCVKSSREQAVKNFIEKQAGEALKMLVFSRELIFERSHRQFKVLDPLFPGYIFVHQKMKEALELVKNGCLHEFVKPICFKTGQEKCRSCFNEQSPCMVHDNEMEFLLNSTDDTGVIKVSYGLKDREQIKIINGPLKYLNNHILWINPKKKKVCVELALFQHTMRINLGFEILKCCAAPSLKN